MSDVINKLEIIENKIDELLFWKVKHTESHELIERDVADNRKILFGDAGEQGIVAKITLLWNGRDRNKDIKNFLLSILRNVISVGILSIIAWLLILYKG